MGGLRCGIRRSSGRHVFNHVRREYLYCFVTISRDLVHLIVLDGLRNIGRARPTDHSIRAQPKRAHGNAGQNAEKKRRNPDGDQPGPVEGEAGDGNDRAGSNQAAPTTDIIAEGLKTIATK